MILNTILLSYKENYSEKSLVISGSPGLWSLTFNLSTYYICYRKRKQYEQAEETSCSWKM